MQTLWSIAIRSENSNDHHIITGQAGVGPSRKVAVSAQFDQEVALGIDDGSARLVVDSTKHLEGGLVIVSTLDGERPCPT